MNRLSEIYCTTKSYLFPMVEEEIGEITGKMKEFLRILEVVRPSRFLTNALRWCGLGRPMKDREKIFRAFLVKSVYDFPITKLLIENLKTNPGLRRLCGWEYSGAVPSEATFSRAFLADPAYDAENIKNFSRKLGHVPIIDINKRRSDAIPLSPAEKRRYCERSGVERTNSDLKDNYGVHHIRGKGHWKVLCHLMFSIIALTVKQLFNMLNERTLRSKKTKKN